ncbi:MAG: class I SAM-dependent methyltransferase [Bacteroidota bacterium]
MNDIFGQALLDYQSGNYTEDLITYSSLEEEAILSLPYLFRDFGNMPLLEQKALHLCYGDILDIGCGAGSHSLYLQEQGFQVTALDRSAGAIATCIERGITHCLHIPVLEHFECYDTVLLLMNGIGIAESLDMLGRYLQHLGTLLKPGGQILLDSSDIIYMFQEGDNIPQGNPYYGEVRFTMTYKGVYGPAFPWLYVDYPTLKTKAGTCNMVCELVSKGNHYDYLARLTLI